LTDENRYHISSNTNKMPQAWLPRKIATASGLASCSPIRMGCLTDRLVDTNIQQYHTLLTAAAITKSYPQKTMVQMTRPKNRTQPQFFANPSRHIPLRLACFIQEHRRTLADKKNRIRSGISGGIVFCHCLQHAPGPKLKQARISQQNWGRSLHTCHHREF